MQDQRQAKVEGFIANLAAMDEPIDFVAIAAQVEAACPRPDRSKGGHPAVCPRDHGSAAVHPIAVQPERRGLRVPGAGTA